VEFSTSESVVWPTKAQSPKPNVMGTKASSKFGHSRRMFTFTSHNHAFAVFLRFPRASPPSLPCLA